MRRQRRQAEVPLAVRRRRQLRRLGLPGHQAAAHQRIEHRIVDAGVGAEALLLHALKRLL